MSCYYIVRVLCARAAGIQIKKKKRHWWWGMRRGIDNYFSVSADIVEFVNKAENTSQESGESDKILVKKKKGG